MGEVAHVALGSNLGDRAAYLAAARSAIALIPGVTLHAVSRVEETASLGMIPQGPYLNQMLAVETTLEPLMLLDALQRIERSLGRVRSPAARWGARTIDLDIVRFGSRAAHTLRLQLPHPGVGARTFWQRELRELDVILVR